MHFLENQSVDAGRRSVPWLVTAVVLGAGLVWGAFLSRVLAEIPGLEWPFYRWGPTLALTAGLGIAFAFAWWLRASKTRFDYTTALPFYLLLFYLLQPVPNLLQAGVFAGSAVTLSLLLHVRPPVDERWIVLLLFLAPLAFYLSTLAPAVGTRDGYELQAVSATMGFAHPTGYPLFPILGRVWIALFPFGSAAWRINVLCALFSAASIPLLYGTARRVLGRPSFAAWCALLLAFSHTFWTQASQPEKYTLNALFVSLILYVAWGTTDPEARGPHPRLRWLAFVYGLSLTHHRTVLMLAPALALYLLWRDPQLLKRPREWLSALGVALAPLLIYLYIPWRAYAQGWQMTMTEFLRYVSGAYYGPAIHLMDWLTPERSRMFWRFTVAQFGYVGIGMGVLGLIGLGVRRRWRFLACTGLAYLAYYVWGTVWYAYYNDVNSFIPNHMIFAVWIGSGAMAIGQACASLWSGRWRLAHRAPVSRAGQALFWLLLALLPMWMIWTNAPQVDMSDDWGMTRWGEYAIGLDIAPGATLLADREKHPPLDYFARVERRRPDVDVVILGDEQAYRDRLAWDLAHGKRVYLARFLPGLEGPYHLRSLGPLVEVGTEPLTLDGLGECAAVKLTTSGIAFGQHVRLLEYEFEESGDLYPGASLRVTLFWQAISQVPGNYQVNLRLVDANGQVGWTSSDHPVSGMYPTAAWKPGEVIPDWHEVLIAGTMPPGAYTLQVGLLMPFSQAGLPLADGGVWLSLRTIDVTAGEFPPQIGRPLRAVAPGRWQLLGYDLPRQAPPTGRVPLTLYWRPFAPLPAYEIGTRLIAAGKAGEWTWVVPGHGTYPTSQWAPGRIVATTHVLTMPAEKGQVTVQVAVREPDQGDRAIAFYPGWLAGRTAVLALPPLAVAGHPPAAPGTANFDDRILLLSADLRQRSLSPGAALELDVRWQCMQAMGADYTLFVHLLAPDGTLKGQIDVWPQDGTHPTSQWKEGETIQDRYLVYLQEDAPPGTYQVAVGWYLLETMQRLPVLNAGGKAIDDKVLLSGLSVER
jgi:hypothetical protein